MLAKRFYLCLAKNVIKLSKLNTLFIIFILILCAFKWGFRWLFVSFGWCFGSCCYRSCFLDCLFVCVCLRVCMRFRIALGRCFFCVFLNFVVVFCCYCCCSCWSHCFCFSPFARGIFAQICFCVVITIARNYDNSISCEFIYPKYVLDYHFQFAVSS